MAAIFQDGGDLGRNIEFSIVYLLKRRYVCVIFLKFMLLYLPNMIEDIYK
jgi:hypothetical protein